MVGVDIHHQLIGIVIAVVEVAGVEHPGDLNTVVWMPFCISLMVSY